MTDVALVAIGTEVVSGQITNTNGSYLANFLTDQGFEVKCQVSVADDDEQMFAALTFAKAEAPLIITIGGLGPTSDDFTRQTIARFVNRDLTFDDEAWQDIVQRFESLGFTPPPSNKSQCYFPKPCRLFENHHGTAKGFLVEEESFTLVALPGPPRELKPMVEEELSPYLIERFKPLRSLRLKRWHVMGHSESKLGEIVHEILGPTNLTVGYRPHRPYVEVKVWYEKEQLDQIREPFKRLESVLGDSLICHDDEDIAQNLLTKWQSFSKVVIVDEISEGYLNQRLLSGYSQKNLDVTTSSFPCPPPRHSKAPPGEFYGHLFFDSQGQATTFFKFSQNVFEQSFPHPHKDTNRLKSYFGELALYSWLHAMD